MSHEISLRKVSKGNFSIIPNDLARDALLTFRATGLFVYLWSFPQSYKFSIESVSNKKTKAGRDAIKRMVRELQNAGYLQITRFRGTDGRFKRVIWTLTDDPIRSPDGENLEPIHKPQNLLEVASSTTSSISRTRKNPRVDNASRKEKDFNVVKTTTTAASGTSVPEQQRASMGDRNDAPQSGPAVEVSLIAPAHLSASDGLAAVSFAIERLGSSDLAQNVLDELDGKIAQQRIKGDWQSYLHGLVKSALDGRFVPAAGRLVAKRRAAKDEERKPPPVNKASPEVVKRHLDNIEGMLKGRLQ